MGGCGEGVWGGRDGSWGKGWGEEWREGAGVHVEQVRAGRSGGVRAGVWVGRARKRVRVNMGCGHVTNAERILKGETSCREHNNEAGSLSHTGCALLLARHCWFMTNTA